MDFIVLVSVALVLSLFLNCHLIYRQITRRRPLSTDATALLHELTRGKAVVSIQVVDASGLFYRSPRG